MDSGAGEIFSPDPACVGPFSHRSMGWNSGWILSGCSSPLFLPHLIPEFDVSQGFMDCKNDKLELGSSQTLVWRMPPPRGAWTGSEQDPEAPQSKENLPGRKGASSCRE